MFVSNMAFFARISDPAMGGTYMTMLNTLSNLGGSHQQSKSTFDVKQGQHALHVLLFRASLRTSPPGMWPGTVTLKLIDFATCKSNGCLVKADGAPSSFMGLSIGKPLVV